MGLLASKLGFSWQRRGRASVAPASDDSEIVRLEPVGRNLPERRSTETFCGDLKSGSLHYIIGSPASSGQPVNESTALGVAAVTACVSLLADMVAKLPLYLYRETKKGPKEVTNHAAARLIAGMPSDFHTSFELRQLMEIGKGLGGNGYARVYRDAFFQPRAIQWLAPCDVEPRVIARPNGERILTYHIQGEKTPLTRADVIHVRGFSRDGVCGLSPIRMLRESIGTSMAQTQAAGRLMRDGTSFPGFLVAQQVLKADQIKDARDEFQSNYAGSKNTGKVPVLNGNFDFKQTNGMSMTDAQFIESRRFELQEIARIYRVPAFLIGDTTSSTTWGSGIEQQTLGFLNFCLDPHLVGWEQSLAATLLTSEEIAAGYHFKFDRDELANVALEARAGFYQTMRNIGVYSANDVRAKLGEPLIAAEDGGDDYGRPFNASGGTPQASEPEKEPEPQPTE